jgi:hypothetical protein
MTNSHWAFLEGFQVVQDGEQYLDRLRIIRTPVAALYLHRIHIPDLGRDPHDHPWWFASVVLCGGYTEMVWDDPRDLSQSRVRTRERFSLRTVSRKKAHRITELHGVLWTLVLTGPQRSSWGFWTQEGFVNWRKYYSHTGSGYVSEDVALWGS